ncbi:hypothetical protein N3K66_004825 [Trichothecium roseum]|uniref:Uncharacterized protein n=1 Tax=Trichothecium roseum TaxID=47278 RepID=A0ACC0V2B6_9HYPO|nr:hypothetical protein N3K66_004825 [Trichothecium roseum]
MSDVGPATADIRSCPPEDVTRLADSTSSTTTATVTNTDRRRRGPFKRGAAACQRCRRRKQKCNGKLPACGPCSAAGSPCVPSERLVVVRADPDCRCAALRERVRELEARIEALVARDTSCASSDPVEPQQHQNHQQRRQGPFCYSSPADEGRRRHRHRSRILGPTFPGSNSGSESVPGPVLRSSPWKLWANDPDGQTPPPPPPPHPHPHPYPHLPQSPPSSSSSAVIAADLPSFSHAESLVEAFFTRRWPHLPVLHKPTFLERDFLPVFAQGCGGGGGGGGGGAGRLSSFRVYMVLAIASAETSTNASPLHSQQQQHHHGHYFAAAVRDLDLVLDGGASPADAAPRGERDLESIQCLLLLCLYGANEPQAIDVWHTLGLALRLALGMDLHREEASSPPPPPSSFHSSSPSFNDGTRSRWDYPLLRREMARRLFWSVYVMDRSMSMAMGRPLGIQDSDITAPFPLLLTDEQLMQEQEPARPHATNPPSPRDMSTFVHVIKLRRINASIHDSFHAAAAEGRRPHATDHDHDRDEAVQALRSAHHADLEAWLVSAPRYPPGSTTAMLQTPEWFQIAHHQAVLSLYRPSRHLITPSPSPSPSSNLSLSLSLSLPNLRLYLDAAIGLVSSYAALRARNLVTYTFVALNALFMASVAMLHALRASPALRAELGRDAAAANVDTCVRLLRGLSPGRVVGARCAAVVARLGAATLGVFDRVGGGGGGGGEEDDDVDEEFMAWFGLKLQRTGHSAPPPHHHHRHSPPPPPPLPPPPPPPLATTPLPVAAVDVMATTNSTPSIDIPWNDFLDQGFDVGYLGFDV